MKYAAIFLIAAALVLPAVSAAPAAGTQTNGFWSSGTAVAVAGGTNYQLHGIAGDFDIFFYTASGSFAGFGIACGADSGRVPSNAAFGVIMKWDDLGEVMPCSGPRLNQPSAFVYVDGL